MFSLIVAMDSNGGIGKKGRLPWRLKEEIKYFKKITTGHIVLMGRKTWESIPEKFRPLPNRLNVILSRNHTQDLAMHLKKSGSAENLLAFGSLEGALTGVENLSNSPFRGKKIFVIGGAKLYSAAILHPDCQKIYLTQIQAAFNCDAFFPDFKGFQAISASDPMEENGISYQYKIFQKGLEN